MSPYRPPLARTVTFLAVVGWVAAGLIAWLLVKGSIDLLFDLVRLVIR